MRRHHLIGLLALSALLLLPAFTAVAQASQRLDYRTKWQSLKVDDRGVALVTYFAHGHTIHALVWGAHDALPPNAAHPRSQVRFNLNYAGGYHSSLGTGYWRRVAKHNVCGPYTGPKLFGVVAACTLPNGSNWALQVWQRELPDNGWNPTTLRESSRELQVSHWRGALPVLWFKADWIYAGARGGPYDHLYGTFSYHGHAVYGFSSTPGGAPNDSFGRLIYVDTRNPPWRKGYRQAHGWFRFNAVLVHRPYGDFCPGVFGTISGVRTRNKPGRGTEYRVTASGPGVTPIVVWKNAPPGHYVPGLSKLDPNPFARGPYSASLDNLLNADQRAIDPHPTRPSSCYHTH